MAQQPDPRKLAGDALELARLLESNEPCTLAEYNHADRKRRSIFGDLATALLDALDRIDELEKVALAQMANESQLMGLYEDFDNGEDEN